MNSNTKRTPAKEGTRRMRVLKSRTHVLCQTGHMWYRVIGPSVPDGMDIEVCGEKGLKELRDKAIKFRWQLQDRGLWSSRERPAGEQRKLAT